MRVSLPSNVQIKTVAVTVLANAISGTTAHNLGFIPNMSAPNPDSIQGVGAIATADITNVTVTLPFAQGTDINFEVITSLN